MFRSPGVGSIEHCVETIPIIRRFGARSDKPEPDVAHNAGRGRRGTLLYAASFKLDIFGPNSIKISAAVLPRDKCCTKITVAADLVPKVQYISRASANTPKRCTRYPDTIARTTGERAGWILRESNCFSPCPGERVEFSASSRGSSFQTPCFRSILSFRIVIRKFRARVLYRLFAAGWI